MSKFLTLSGFKKDQFIIELKVFVPKTQIVGYDIKELKTCLVWWHVKVSLADGNQNIDLAGFAQYTFKTLALSEEATLNYKKQSTLEYSQRHIIFEISWVLH